MLKSRWGEVSHHLVIVFYFLFYHGIRIFIDFHHSMFLCIFGSYYRFESWQDSINCLLNCLWSVVVVDFEQNKGLKFWTQKLQASLESILSLWGFMQIFPFCNILQLQNHHANRLLLPPKQMSHLACWVKNSPSKTPPKTPLFFKGRESSGIQGTSAVELGGERSAPLLQDAVFNSSRQDAETKTWHFSSTTAERIRRR